MFEKKNIHIIKLVRRPPANNLGLRVLGFKCTNPQKYTFSPIGIELLPGIFGATY